MGKVRSLPPLLPCSSRFEELTSRPALFHFVHQVRSREELSSRSQQLYHHRRREHAVQARSWKGRPSLSFTFLSNLSQAQETHLLVFTLVGFCRLRRPRRRPMRLRLFPRSRRSSVGCVREIMYVHPPPRFLLELWHLLEDEADHGRLFWVR